MGKEAIDTDQSDQSTTRVIVVKKGGRGHAAHHGGAWKVAYADFVTAMMAFFIVMWLISQGSAVKQAVQEYFKDPLGFNEKVKAGVLFGSGMAVIPGGGMDQKVFEDAQRRAMNQAAENLKKEFEGSPELESIKNSINIKVTEEGLLVELLESEKTNFFDVGSANLKAETAEILSKIAKEFGQYNNRVIIDGHTDARPYSTQSGYSNWELSADRANSARRVMDATGLNDGQVLAVRGYAAEKLKNVEDPFDVTNRRIGLLLLNRSPKEMKDTLFVKKK
jgi:chemotaxis protein MotB